MFQATGTAIANFPEKVPQLLGAVAGEERDPEGPISVVGASRVGGQALEAGFVLLFVLLFAGFNIFIGVFNLFPLLPLDGGHIAVLCSSGPGPGSPVRSAAATPGRSTSTSWSR